MNNLVPIEWSCMHLGNIFKILKGTIVPQNNPTEILDYYSIPTFDQTGTGALVCGSDIESNKTLLSEPSILVSKLNPRKPRVQVISDNPPYRQCASTEFIAYSPKDPNIDLVFFKYYFLSEYFSIRLQQVATGSTNSHVRVTPGETLKWHIPKPPLPEQKKIATILSSVDEVIEKTRAQIEKLKDLKTGMMQELLTKGIGHTEFKDSPVGRIPNSWVVKALHKMITIKHGYPFEGEYFSSTPSPYTLLTPGNFNKDGRLYFGPKTKYYTGPVPVNFILQNGDVLVVMTDLTKEMAILGNTIILQSLSTVLHNQRIGKLELIDARIMSTEFLCLVMNSDRVQQHIKDTATGTTVRHTSPTKILEPEVPVPPLLEQSRITAVMQTLEAKLSTVEAKLTATQELKTALMQDLLTGKVRVNVNQEEVATA